MTHSAHNGRESTSIQKAGSKTCQASWGLGQSTTTAITWIPADTPFTHRDPELLSLQLSGTCNLLPPHQASSRNLSFTQRCEQTTTATFLLGTGKPGELQYRIRLSCVCLTLMAEVRVPQCSKLNMAMSDSFIRDTATIFHRKKTASSVNCKDKPPTSLDIIPNSGT